MRRLRFSKIVVLVFLGSIMGCVNNGINAPECLTPGQRLDMYRSLQLAWPKHDVSNSDSCHSARGWAQVDEKFRKSFDCFRNYGYELDWVYKLTDWFLLETRNLGNGGLKYFRLRMNPLTEDVEFRSFDLKERSWLFVDCYAPSLRYAPIVEDTLVGFTEMWDSLSDTIVSVPDGFHAIIQGGMGLFLLRKDADGEYYRWDAINRSEPEIWKYYFPKGWNFRSSFFIALSSENGKRYAFAVGLEPIPNSEGAMAISPCGAYKGRQYYGLWKGPSGDQRHYYAWPERDSAEPLSNGTETFGGGFVVYRDGRLVVLTPTGPTPVDEFQRMGINE